MWVSVSKGRKWQRFSQTREEGAGPPPQQSACPVDTPANRYKLGKCVNSAPHTPEGHFNMKTQRKEAASQFPTPGSPKCAPQNSRPRRGSYATHTHTHTHVHTYTDAQTCARTHTHAYTHTYILADTHTVNGLRVRGGVPTTVLSGSRTGQKYSVSGTPTPQSL